MNRRARKLVTLLGDKTTRLSLVLTFSMIVTLGNSLLFAQTSATPLNLGPAVDETKQVFRDYGLPADWYASLKPDAEGNDPLLVTGIWTMVGPPAAEKFKQRFRTKRAPTSNLYVGAVETDNAVFEEVALRALIGQDHQHLRYRRVYETLIKDLPNIDTKFLKTDGSVKFTAIRDAFANKFKQGSTPQNVNDNESVVNESDENAQVVSDWRKPTGNYPEWAVRQLAWRTVIRVEFVDDKRNLTGLEINGGRRLVISSYVQIGYRRADSQPFRPIHLAGPFHETVYKPVGRAQVSLTVWRCVIGVEECKRHFGESDLDSLNRELSAEEQEQLAKASANKVPMAEQPNLTSVRSRADITRLHKEMHEVIAPGKPSVPLL